MRCHRGQHRATVDTSGPIAGVTTTIPNDLVVSAIATSLPDAYGTANFSAWTNANLSSLTERTDNTRDGRQRWRARQRDGREGHRGRDRNTP